MDKLLFLLPYILSFALSLGVLAYTWRFRNVRGARAYAWYVAGQCLWILGYIFELINPSLDGKIFWDQIQWVAGLFITIGFPIFSIQYTVTKIRRARLLFGLSFVVPLLFLGILFTDSQHHLLYPNPYLDHTHIFSDLKYDFTWVLYAYAIYGYLVTLTGLGILIKRLIRPHRLYRRQIITVAIGFFIPIFFTMLTVAGVEFIPFRDVTPFSFAFGNLVVAWGLFRYHLFDIIPIARDIVVENMEDLVVVLDMQDRVVDINSAALEALHMDSRQVLGQPAATIFAPWPELVEKFFKPENIKTEISLSESDEINPFEIKSTILRDKKNRFTGRVFVARDVTERVNLQIKLEKLNHELEKTVRERTKELRNIAEQYRTVVENQSELIVRWKPDRTRTFVNEAYCRYFGLSQEQALVTDFLTFIIDDDRPAIEEKISRLLSGISNSETEIHRVLKPNGNIGWQEWTDQVIRDEAGDVIEFQSVGRDITERIQAEKELRTEKEFTEYALNSQTDTFFVYELSTGNAVRWNKAFRITSGYSDDEIRSLKAPNSYYNDKDLEKANGVIQQILTGGTATLELSLLTKDGSSVPTEYTATAIKDAKGNPKHIIAIGRDITTRKQAEKALRESEKRLRAIVDSAPFGAHLYQLEADGRLIFSGANRSADQILQVDHQQFIGKSIEEAFPPLAETDIPAAYRAVATSGERFEMDQVDYDDAGIRGAFEIHAFQTGENRMAVFFRDITERKQAKEALIESEERFSILAAASFEGIVISDKGRVIDCNEQLATMLGYEQSEMIGLEVKKFVAPESLAIVLEHIQSGSEEPYEHLSLRKDGTKFPVEIRAKSIPFKGRQVRVTAIWDITDRKQAEHDLLEAYDTTLKGWAKALELRDKETEDHSQRVTELTVTLAQAMGVAEKDLIHFRRGAILHDIGKMGIPDEILRKRGPLTDTERYVVNQHPLHGYELLSPIPYLEKALDIPYCHHERWDGTGYPRGLKGEEIPLAARIFTVVDVWDALLSNRPYSKAWSKEDTIQYLKDESGKIFDPKCVSLFLELVEQHKI